jgi:hypothetical protein
LRQPVLSRRVPYQEIALIYSARNKDWTYQDNRTFNQYLDGFNNLSQRHLPFRILPLETLTAADLQGIGAVVLPGIESMTDGEFALLNSHPVILLGENGTRDHWFNPRATPLEFAQVITWADLRSGLPFSLTAPATTLVEYYADREDPAHFFVFVFSPLVGGNIVLQSPTPLHAEILALDQPPRAVTASNINVEIKDYLYIIDVKRAATPDFLDLLLSNSTRSQVALGNGSFSPKLCLGTFDVKGRIFTGPRFVP